MATAQGTGMLMKRGIIIALVIVVVRIGLELLGAPNSANNIFGVAWLYLIMPVLFAWHISAIGEASPFRALFKEVLFFALYTRLIVWGTYMLAYLYQWEAPRFSVKMGGNVGGNAGPFMGLLLIPLRNAIFWILSATLVGMIIGGITLRLKKRSST